MSYFDKVCQQWQCEADGNLAHSVQEEEYDDKKNYNVNTRKIVGGDITVARRVHDNLQNNRDSYDSSTLCDKEVSKLKEVIYIQAEPEVLELSNLDSEIYSTVELANIFRKSRFYGFDDEDEQEDYEEPAYQTRLPEPIQKVEKVSHFRSVPVPSIEHSRDEEYDFESLQRLIRGGFDPAPDVNHMGDSLLARELQDEELAKMLQAEENRKAQQRKIRQQDEVMAKSLEETGASRHRSRTVVENITFGQDTSHGSSSSATPTTKVRKTKRTCVLVYKGMSGEEAVAKYLQDVERKNSTQGGLVEYTNISVQKVTPGEHSENYETTSCGPSRTIFHGKKSEIKKDSMDGDAQSAPKEKPQRPPLPDKKKLPATPHYSVPKNNTVKTGSTLWYSGYADEGNYSWGQKSASVNKPSLTNK